MAQEFMHNGLQMLLDDGLTMNDIKDMLKVIDGVMRRYKKYQTTTEVFHFKNEPHGLIRMRVSFLYLCKPAINEMTIQFFIAPYDDNIIYDYHRYVRICKFDVKKHLDLFEIAVNIVRIAIDTFVSKYRKVLEKNVNNPKAKAKTFVFDISKFPLPENIDLTDPNRDEVGVNILEQNGYYSTSFKIALRRLASKNAKTTFESVSAYN